SLGCHALSAITDLKVRDRGNEQGRQGTEPPWLGEQMRAAVEDSTVAAVKIGDLAAVARAEAVHTILGEYSDIPVVLDPVLHHGADDGDVDEAVRVLLFPRATVSILSISHVQQLSTCGDSLGANMQELLEFGCPQLLVTVAAQQQHKIINRLFSTRGVERE